MPVYIFLKYSSLQYPVRKSLCLHIKLFEMAKKTEKTNAARLVDKAG